MGSAGYRGGAGTARGPAFRRHRPAVAANVASSIDRRYRRHDLRDWFRPFVSPLLALILADAQHGQKRFLRNLDAAHALHALLAFLLLLEQFALARDVAAVAFG